MGKPKRRVYPRAANHVNRDRYRLTILCLISAVTTSNAPWERNSFGRPCWDPKVAAVCVFMKIFLGRTYDTIEAYLKSNQLVAQHLGVEELPGQSVIARGMSKMPMSYIRLISRLVTFQMRRRGMNVAVDSSGFSLKTSSKWFDIRIKRKSTKRDYIKLHIVIDVETGIILHFTITNWKGSDSKEFKRLIKDLPRLNKAAGDKAYSSRANCQAVADKKGKPFLCFKANATAKAKGFPAWQISFNAYTDNPDEWMDEYHIRSIVESVFSSIKRCLGSDIKSIKGWLKRRELAIKVLAYNIKRVLYIEEAKELGIPLWVNCQ
jgi:transposase